MFGLPPHHSGLCEEFMSQMGRLNPIQMHPRAAATCLKLYTISMQIDFGQTLIVDGMVAAC